MMYAIKMTCASVLAGMLLASSAQALPILQVRCASTDALDTATAPSRLEWARACGDRMNVRSASAPVAPAFSYLTGQTSSNGVSLVEYVETSDFWGRNSYSGVNAAVNQMFFQMQWRTSAILATTAAGGFQRWDGAPGLLLQRPLYPTFGNNADINTAIPLFPNPTYDPADCNLYTDPAGTHVYNASGTGFYVNGYCASANSFVAASAERSPFENDDGGLAIYVNRILQSQAIPEAVIPR